MALPPSSFELIARAHRVTAGFNARVRESVGSLPGNPGRVRVERFGGAWATRCDLSGAPPWMNLLGPLTPDDLDALVDALQWYGVTRPLIEVTPSPYERHAVLARELSRHGAAATGMLDILWGPVPAPHDVADASPGVVVAPVRRDEAMLFARTLLSGHVESFHDHEIEGLAALVGAGDVRCHLARIDGEPAAAAIFTVADGLGYLANASALPAYRNRGCHSALLAARLRDAADAQCELVIALAAVGSTSHRNMERSGLRTLVTVTQWTFPGGAGT